MWRWFTDTLIPDILSSGPTWLMDGQRPQSITAVLVKTRRFRHQLLLAHVPMLSVDKVDGRGRWRGPGESDWSATFPDPFQPSGTKTSNKKLSRHTDWASTRFSARSVEASKHLILSKTTKWFFGLRGTDNQWLTELLRPVGRSERAKSKEAVNGWNCSSARG